MSDFDRDPFQGLASARRSGAAAALVVWAVCFVVLTLIVAWCRQGTP